MNKRLNELLDESERDLFEKIVSDIAKQFTDIIGVLGVGSLVQSSIIPDNFFTPKYTAPRGLAYEQIRNPGRRRLAVHEESDLDIWICTKDTDAVRDSRQSVEIAAIALLSELTSGTLKRGTEQWFNKKAAVFGHYYKNPKFYSEEFISANDNKMPWMALGFKKMLEVSVIEHMPAFVKTVNNSFEKKIPGGFFEVRAFPESLFHLRPDDSVMPNSQEDRMPFPRIADDQWINPEHSSLVLYSSNEVTIYPFKADGHILGSGIADFLRSGSTDSTKAYGAIALKPDAFKRSQVDIITTKIYAGINSFGGRIAVQKTLDPVTDINVETMYPLLKGRELQEAKDYLVGGKMTIFIIEAPMPRMQLFKHISLIKGPRLADRTYERLLEGRIITGSIRDLLPIPGEEKIYKELIPTILQKKADVTVRFSDEQYKYYAQNLAHSPDNEIELEGLFKLANFLPE